MRTQGFSEEIQMKRKILIGGIALPALAFCFACASSTEAQLGGPENKAPEQFAASNYVVSGPYSHKNLTIFLLHGADQRQDKTPLTLQEAMDRKMVVVHETGDVNNLAVENLSDEEVYVQSGDIVKGGRQDRVLALDLIVPPKSGKIQIASFCVEQGRWSGRGQEEAGQFASSRKALSSKDLKIAAKHSVSQGEVWDKVSQSQAKLSAGVVAADPEAAALPAPPAQGQVAAGGGGGTASARPAARGGEFSVASSLSSSSLQLSLENENLKQVVDDYVKKLSPIIEGKTYGQPQADAVKAFLVDSESGKADEKELTSRVTSVKRETEKNLFFETRDRNRSKTWVHRNYLAK